MVNYRRFSKFFLLIAVLGVGLFGMAGRAHAEVARDPQPLTVMTFNIRYDNPGDGDNRWGLRKNAVAQQILDLDPEILCLQEALRHQLDELHRLVPGYVEIGVGRDDGLMSGEYCAILVKPERFSVVDQGTWWLAISYRKPGATSYGNTIPRIVTWAVLTDVSGDTLSVFNTHLDHQSQESREYSVAQIREFMDDYGAGAILLAGDFNAGEDNPALKPMFRRYYWPETIITETTISHVNLIHPYTGMRLPWHQPFRDTFRELHPEADSVGTFNSWTGNTSGDKIDYVFASIGWEILDAGILNEMVNGRYTSDHFPVYATVKLTPEDLDPERWD